MKAIIDAVDRASGAHNAVFAVWDDKGEYRFASEKEIQQVLAANQLPEDWTVSAPGVFLRYLLVSSTPRNASDMKTWQHMHDKFSKPPATKDFARIPPKEADKLKEFFGCQEDISRIIGTNVSNSIKGLATAASERAFSASRTPSFAGPQEDREEVVNCINAMRELRIAAGYKYSHDYDGHAVFLEALGLEHSRQLNSAGLRALEALPERYSRADVGELFPAVAKWIRETNACGKKIGGQSAEVMAQRFERAALACTQEPPRRWQDSRSGAAAR